MESTPEMTPESNSETAAQDAVTPAPATEPTPEAPAPVEPPPVVVTPAAESPIPSTVSVPADPNASDSEGGEWHLLMEKLNAWLADAKLMELWQQSQRPLKLVGGALALLLVLQLTSAVLGTLDAIPMLPRLLQLTGLIYVVLFASRRLVRSDERRSLIEGVKNGWSSFTGK
ncbi:MAG: CAAD domain-containing protein [Synechococcus sp.]